MQLELQQALIQKLAEFKPVTTLLVSPNFPAELESFLDKESELEFDHIIFRNIDQSIAPLGKYDFVVVAETLEHIEVNEAEQLVSQLRDLHAKLLWVLLPESEQECYNRNNAVAQGMRMVDSTEFGTGKTQWYEFSLKFYKPVPQWLNAKNWANPERWNKARW